MTSRLPTRARALLFLPFLLILTARPGVAQPTASDAEQFQARINATATALGSNPRYKNLSPQYRQRLVEFVAGNMLFVLVHELGHAAISELGLPVLGKQEDAADSFAATELIRIGSGVSNRVVMDAAEGWFMADRRDRSDGNQVPYYDEHGLDQVRAYQIVCFMVGSDRDKFKDLAAETKLPESRQESCANDFKNAVYAWNLVLKPHRRAPDQPKTRIDTVYGEAKGRLGIIAQGAQSIQLLEIVARQAADQLAWPTPFTLEGQTCGFINARWVASAHKLTLCYELAADFADLFRSYGEKQLVRKKRGS
jgi:hypothetical protein